MKQVQAISLQVIYIKTAKHFILKFLTHIGSINYFETHYPIRPTPKSRVYRQKDTARILAQDYGDVFFYKGIGKIYNKKEPIGYLLNFTTLEKKEFVAPFKGMMYFRRIDTRIKPLTARATTLAGLIPTGTAHNTFLYTRSLSKRFSLQKIVKTK